MAKKKQKLSKDDVLANFGVVPSNITDLFSEKKYDECATACQKILVLEPYNDIALLYMGYILREQKDYKKSIHYYSRAVKHRPALFIAWYNKGVSHLEIKEYAQAKKSFIEYIKLVPHKAVPWGFVSVCEYIQNKRDAAVAWLDIAEGYATEEKEFIPFLRGLFLKDTDPDTALLYFLEAQTKTQEEGLKEFFGAKAYKLLLDNTDPLKRSGLN